MSQSRRVETGRPATGFTLLEVLVGIVLAGIVALLVYGTLAAASDTHARLGEQRRLTQIGRAWRATVEDALRNARPAPTPGELALVVETRFDATGRPMDRVRFLTAGGLPPLTADTDWEVTIDPAPAGISFVARPVGVAAPALRVTGPAFVTGLDVRVLSPVGRTWTDRWRFPSRVPLAIELTYWTDSGPLPPVRLALPLGVLR
jgi:prepilin-type N-terminal cleavage/methylation domain-containing protein